MSELIQNHKSVAIVDGLAMLSSVLNLALTIYPKEIPYVDQLLSFCLKCVDSVPEADINNITLKVHALPALKYLSNQITEPLVPQVAHERDTMLLH